MALRLADKKEIVSQVANVAKQAVSAAAADYRGLTVSQMNELRNNARKGGVFLKIMRNTLAHRALEETEFTCLKEVLVGPLILGFSREEPSAVARLFRDFSKENEQLEVKALALGGQLHDAKAIDKIAKLPTRDEGIAILMQVMQAPITKFVRTLAEPHAKLVRLLAAIRDKKQAA
ncbi:MAG: 50S ribosomal protein L10 [Pseudomonadota bacterium]